MKPIAEFEGYMGDLAIIKWTGEERLSAGAKLYALPVLDAAPVLPTQERVDGRDIEVWWKRIGCVRNPGTHTGEEAARDAEIAELRAALDRAPVLPVQAQPDDEPMTMSMFGSLAALEDARDRKEAALAATQPAAAPEQADPQLEDLLAALQKAAILLRAAGFSMIGTATSQIMAAINAAAACTVPPPGWQCTRQAGHDGPCAAIAAAPSKPAIQAGDAIFKLLSDGDEGKPMVFWQGHWYGGSNGVGFDLLHLLNTLITQQADGGGAA